MCTQIFKRTVLILVLLGIGTRTAVAEIENALEEWSASYQRGALEVSPPIAVSATLRMRDGNYYLVFRISNISKRPVRTYTSLLPWNNPYAIELAAVTTDGKALSNAHPFYDGTFDEQTSIAPGQTREGEFQLSLGLSVRDLPKDRDTIVLWSYQFLDTTHFEPPRVFDPRKPLKQLPVCTGALVIPKPK